MKNVVNVFSSIFYKMTDKVPILQEGDTGELSATDGGGSSSDDHATTRIVRFRRISEDQPASSSVNNSGFTEQEMLDSVACPSCDGSGRIPKNRERQLVALIPLTDKRLKPRRTTLYVLVAILASVVVCGLCMFFLIPRSITLTSSGFKIIPYAAEVNETEKLIKLNFINRVNISNNNFVSIKIVNATMASVADLASKQMVGQITNLTEWTLSLRQSGVVAFNTSITFTDPAIIEYCKWLKVIYMQFNFMVTSRYLGHDEQTSLTVDQRLYCTTEQALFSNTQDDPDP